MKPLNYNTFVPFQKRNMHIGNNIKGTGKNIIQKQYFLIWAIMTLNIK
jgi:hypothetical protein